MLITRQAAATAAAGEGTQGSHVAEEGKTREGGDGSSGTPSEVTGTPFVELKSFTTQAFFVCWRGLHLGLLEVRGDVLCCLVIVLCCACHLVKCVRFV